MARGLVVLGLVGFGLGGATAAAQPTTVPPLVGATEVIKLTPATGFIDDVVAVDAERVVYIVADAASRAELHVVPLATKQEQVIDIAKITLKPIGLQLAGPRVLVIGAADDGKQTATMLELVEKSKTRPAGSVVYKLAPAAHVTPITRDGKLRLAVHRTTATAAGTRHDIELVALETGKRIGAARSVELDAKGASKQHDFRINHWSDGWTRAYGIKGGEWDRKENQRTPDVEASFDVLAGKFDKKKIEDPVDQKKRFQALAAAGGRIDFVRTSWDNKSVELWLAGKLRVLELDQPFASYDPKSLQGVVNADGSVWIALKTDPVNADAVARKKADPEYLDVFRAPADGKATRKARVLAPGARHRFGVAGDRFWLLERNQAFERGGKSLTLYATP